MGTSPSFPIVSYAKDYVVIVTGGNSGLGYQTAKWIAMMGATVILACRSEEKALQAIKQMNEEFEKEKLKGTPGVVDYEELCVEFMKLDTASLKSVVEFTTQFKSTGRKLHTLIANAGISMQKRGYTEDNHELHFQVNYLGHFLMMAHLLPVMKTSGDDCRIVMISSGLYNRSNFNMETIEGKQCSESNFGRVDYYGRSKMYQIMQMFSMNRRLKNTNVTVTAVDPGIVQTPAVATFSDMKLFMCIFCCAKTCGLAKKPFDGAKSQINCAVNTELKGVRDVLYGNCRPISISPTARNTENQETIWKYTMECLDKFMEDDIKKRMEGND